MRSGDKMDVDASIRWLGSVHSGTCMPKRLEELDPTLPYIHLSRSPINSAMYSVSMFNHKLHDNADRMAVVCDFLSNRVLPRVTRDVSGYYSIELHDTYTYLDNGKDYDDVLCFGKSKGGVSTKGPVMLPDIYFMQDWGGKYNRPPEDAVKWVDKKSGIVFCGSTTGSREPLMNERIKMCLWAVDRRPVCNFFITNIAQMSFHRIMADVPNFRQIYRSPMSLPQQSLFRYHLSIDGNTCRWNPDTFFTKSLGFAMPSPDMLWYHPLIHANTHFVEVTVNDIVSTFEFYENNHPDAARIMENANRLGRQLFNIDAATRYTIALFEGIGENRR